MMAGRKCVTILEAPTGNWDNCVPTISVTRSLPTPFAMKIPLKNNSADKAVILTMLHYFFVSLLLVKRTKQRATLLKFYTGSLSSS